MSLLLTLFVLYVLPTIIAVMSHAPSLLGVAALDFVRLDGNWLLCGGGLGAGRSFWPASGHAELGLWVSAGPT